ncbi:MAG TPA: PHP domain-containing protein [Bryobacteraceae bacterium]
MEFVDLHSHTNESDGTAAPVELVQLAMRVNLAALAITDHDTFAGYEKALPFARQHSFDLIRGIELNSRLYVPGAAQPRFAHVLGYFPSNEPASSFYSWLQRERESRRERNLKLIEALAQRGIAITLEEVEARGRSLAGRPHFARILVEKGHAKNLDDAFRKYLGEDAPCYVERESHSLEEVIRIVRSGGGIPVIAHPIRLALTPEHERQVLASAKQAGLLGLEVHHSEHSAAMRAHYDQLAKDLELVPTGGSDFHGDAKPNVRLGEGVAGNVRAPRTLLDGLRAIPTIGHR